MLNSFIEGVSQEPVLKTITTVFAVVIGLLLTIYLFRRYQINTRRSRYPKDIVILHQPFRGLRAPSPSPFVLKLETWLRMAKIPYQNEFGMLDVSSKHQIPYITFNGLDVADSQFSIEFLSQKMNIDLNKHLTDEQKAIGRCVLKLVEESLRWCTVLHRIVYNPDPKESGLKRYVLLFILPKARKHAYGHGYGRHTKEEVYEIGRKDLKALNDIIGEKKFLFGDDACDVDAATFGVLAQIVYHDRGPLNDYLIKSCPNIAKFVDNMKTAFWPDWDSNVTEKPK